MAVPRLLTCPFQLGRSRKRHKARPNIGSKPQLGPFRSASVPGKACYGRIISALSFVNHFGGKYSLRFRYSSEKSPSRCNPGQSRISSVPSDRAISLLRLRYWTDLLTWTADMPKASPISSWVIGNGILVSWARPTARERTYISHNRCEIRPRADLCPMLVIHSRKTAASMRQCRHNAVATPGMRIQSSCK